jgi:hypothetical protein
MATYFDPTSSTVTTVSFDMDSIARAAQIPSHPAPITMYFVIEEEEDNEIIDGKICRS